MTLQEFVRSLTPEDREKFATDSGTTVAYLYQLSGGHSIPSPKLARRLAENSNGLLSAARLRPDIFGEIAA